MATASSTQTAFVTQLTESVIKLNTEVAVDLVATAASKNGIHIAEIAVGEEKDPLLLSLYKRVIRKHVLSHIEDEAEDHSSRDPFTLTPTIIETLQVVAAKAQEIDSEQILRRDSKHAHSVVDFLFQEHFTLLGSRDSYRHMPLPEQVLLKLFVPSILFFFELCPDTLTRSKRFMKRRDHPIEALLTLVFSISDNRYNSENNQIYKQVLTFLRKIAVKENREVLKAPSDAYDRPCCGRNGCTSCLRELDYSTPPPLRCLFSQRNCCRQGQVTWNGEETKRWKDLVWAVLPACLEMMEDASPLALAFSNLDPTEDIDICKAIHEANPKVIVTQRRRGNFPINCLPLLRRNKVGGENLFRWHIHTYIESYENYHPQEDPDGYTADGNLLHIYATADYMPRGGCGMLQVIDALPPNHPMLTEWNSRGVTPLHLLVRQGLSNGTGLERHMIQRHPNALQRRTKNGQHVLQIVLSKCGYKQRQQSAKLLDYLYFMIRTDPVRCCQAMRGNLLCGAKSNASATAPRKKKRRRKRY